MDLTVVHLLIKKRKSSARLFIDENQYTLKETLAYIRLHPARMVHVITMEEEDQTLEAYFPTDHPSLEKMIQLAMKSKIFKTL